MSETVSQSIFQELDFFTASFLLGAFLVLCYDCLRIFRQLVRHGVLWISLEDFCYWVMAAFAVFAMLYKKNDGLIRGFSIGGVVLGMLLCNYLISRFLVRFLVMILKKIITLVKRVLAVLTRPFRKAIRTCVPKILILKRIFKKLTRNLKKELKKIQKEIKMGLSR